jgi:hypothetical protein
MITINSSGRMGNKIHYYLLGKYLHKITGMHFTPERIEDFPNTYFEYPGKVKNYNIIKTSDITIKTPEDLEFFKTHNGGITVDNMIPFYDVFKEFSVKDELIIDNEDKYEKPGLNDLVVHLRLGDYRSINGYIFKLEDCLDIIKKETFDNCYIVTDSPDDFYYLSEFKKLNCKIKSGTRIEDFVFLKNAKKLYISRSTFSWFAAILSDAKVYFPIKNIDHNDHAVQYMNPLDNNWIIV